MDDDEDIEIEESEAAVRKGASSGEITLFAWLAIFTAVCFIAVITLQVVEFLHYSSPPSVWPATP